LRRGGFTLVELMVVIGIVCVLAGLIGTAMQVMRARANSARCVSNLRQWGAALQLYDGDNAGYIPRRGQGVQQLFQINRPDDWFNALPPYMGMQSYQSLVAQGRRPNAGDNSVFICPSATDPGATYFLPYGMNMYLSPWIRPQEHRITQIPNPEQLAFMADAPGPYASTIPSTLPFSVLARHSGRANVCFVDGHVVSYDGTYIGCGIGEPTLSDIRWQTLTSGINEAPLP
jgi:prepilin-type processing-associated H-X9-DG protein/prepilin-type N-terminal cleavage/methylation domain-containing protein